MASKLDGGWSRQRWRQSKQGWAACVTGAAFFGRLSLVGEGTQAYCRGHVAPGHGEGVLPVLALDARAVWAVLLAAPSPPPPPLPTCLPFRHWPLIPIAAPQIKQQQQQQQQQQLLPAPQVRKAPASLYDPRVPSLRAVLDPAAFPAPPFDAARALDAMAALGLQGQATLEVGCACSGPVSVFGVQGSRGLRAHVLRREWRYMCCWATHRLIDTFPDMTPSLLPSPSPPSSGAGDRS